MSVLYIYTSPVSFAVEACTRIDNGDGTISAQRQTDGLFLSRDSTGTVKWQQAISADEKFTVAGKKLLSVNTFPDKEHATYYAFPFEEV